jgi:hypothetical protein
MLKEVVPSAAIQTRCPYCHQDADALDDGSIACGVCLARHHAACWREAGGSCASCRSERKLVPEQPANDASLALLLRRGHRELAERILRSRGFTESEARAFCEGVTFGAANRGPRGALGLFLLAVLLAMAATLANGSPRFIHSTVPLTLVVGALGFGLAALFARLRA